MTATAAGKQTTRRRTRKPDAAAVADVVAGLAAQAKGTPEQAESTPEKPSKGKQPAAARPAAKKPEKPSYLRTVKGVEQQLCAGACGRWLPLDAFPRKSAARGGGPIRRCKTCIAAERKARQDAAEKQAEKATASKTSSRSGGRSKPAQTPPSSTTARGGAK